MPDTLNQIEVTTRRYIDENPELRDLVFNHDPTMAMIGEDCHEQVAGGSSWNDNIEYDVQDGGPYSKGQDLPADQRQIEQQLRFDPKYNAIMIPFYMEDIKVLNNGPEAVVNLVEERVDSAFMQLGAQAALKRYLQGQSGNFIKFPNGLLEALSDGTNVGWDGNTYPVYGTLIRKTYGGRMLSPAPYNFAGGSITLPILEQLYDSVVFGSGKYEPNIITTTVKGYGYLRTNFQTQQRFQNVTTAKGGFRGLEYNGAVIVMSRYAPGSYLMNPAGGVAAVQPGSATASINGQNDIVAKRMFAYATDGQVTAYPTPVTMFGNGTVANTGGSSIFGETIFVENIRKPMVKYRTSKSRPFDGSLQEFIPSAGNTKLVGKVLLAENWSILPGYHTYGFNFQG